MKIIYYIVVLFVLVTNSIYAQVGIGTTTPDIKAQLDITSTSKGILIPRLSFAQRNAITSPTTSLLIYQIDNTPGFYYYNGILWEKLALTSALDDGDWTVSGTNMSSNNTGSILIGTTTSNNYKLSVDGFLNTINIGSTNNNQDAVTINKNNQNGNALVVNQNSSYNSTNKSAISAYNALEGQQVEIAHFSNTNSLNASVYAKSQARRNNSHGFYYESIPSNNYSGNFYGSRVKMNHNGSNGIIYGFHSLVEGTGNSAKYGLYTKITTTATGRHFGVYSEVLNPAGYAGYFLGKIAIGTTNSNTYSLPSSRGTNGQVLRTNGTGNTSWANPNNNFSMISVHRLSSIIIPAANTWQSIPFTNESFDTNNEFNTVTNKFTVITSGYYQINAMASSFYTTISAPHYFSFAVFRNNVKFIEDITTTATSGFITKQISRLVYLTAGNILDVRFNNYNQAITFQPGYGKTYFTIHRVR